MWRKCESYRGFGVKEMLKECLRDRKVLEEGWEVEEVLTEYVAVGKNLGESLEV
jgi:hypothetical protein